MNNTHWEKLFLQTITAHAANPVEEGKHGATAKALSITQWD